MLSDDLPQDLPTFIARFGSDEACRDYLFQQRWPDGFRCRACGHDDAWMLGRRNIYECTACGQQHSLLKGTIFEQTKLVLRPAKRDRGDRPRQMVSRHLPGDLEQGRHRRHRAAAADGLRQLRHGLGLAAQDPQGPSRVC
jgi:hypothetical protein